MFVVIRRYAAGARADEVAQRIGKGLVPILRAEPGFRAYYAFVDEDGRPISVSIVDSRPAAIAANERARAWVTANMADLISGSPEVSMGTMLVDAATFNGRASQEAERAAAELQEVSHDALD
jgi:hypothetical protein